AWRRRGEARAVAVAESPYVTERAPLGDFADREIELAVADEIDGPGRGQRPLALDGDVSSHEADAQRGIFRPEGFGDFDVLSERRCTRVQDGEVVLPRERAHVVQRQAIGRRIDQARAGHEGSGLSEPGRIPEGADFAARLIARSGAAVEALIRGRMEKERSQVTHDVVRRSRPW